MTGVSDKPKHRPSAKHTLEDVRKSLEDLVRHQLDDAPPAEMQIKGGQRQQDETVDAPQEAAPQRSRHRLHGSGSGQLDTGQVLQSLRALLGNELGGPGVNQQDAGASVDESLGLRRAEDTATEDSGHDAATMQDRPETPAAGGDDARELESLMEAESVEDIDLDMPHKHDEASVDLDEIMASTDEDGTDTRSALVHEIDIDTAETQDKSALEALAGTARPENKDLSRPAKTELAHSQGDRERAVQAPGASETDEPGMEAKALRLTDDEQDATVPPAAPPVLAQAAPSERPAQHTPERGSGLSEPQPIPQTRRSAVDEMRAVAPEASPEQTPSEPGAATHVDAAQTPERARSSERAPATTDIAQSGIIDISSLDGVQQAFIFEDPALAAAVHRRETPKVVESQRDEDVVTANVAADVRPAPRTQTARKRGDSELGLEEESPGLEAAPQGPVMLSDASPREQVVADTPVSPDTDASDEKEIELSGRGRSREDTAGTAGDGITASDDRSDDLEDLASTLASMDVLEIPGGEQLSDELTQRTQAPTLDDIAEGVPLAEPPSDPHETSLAPESPAPERSVKKEDASVAQGAPDLDDITLVSAPEAPQPATKDDASAAGSPSHPGETSLAPESPAPDRGLRNEAAHATEGPSSTGKGDSAASADHNRDQPKRILSAVVQGQSASLKMPGIDFDLDARIAGADADTQSDQPVRAPIGAKRKKKPASTRTSAKGKPAVATTRKERRADADFVELGGAVTEKPRFAGAPGDTLEASILSRGESAKSPPAPFAHKAETPSARPPGMPRRSEPKDPGSATTVARTSTARGAPSTTPHLSTPSDKPKIGPAESRSSATKAGPGKIPVLRDVVTQPPVDMSATEARKKESSVTANAKSSTELALDKGPARVKSKKPSKAERAGARTLAVRVIAKLNMELRRCGERALSPAIIDRLQFLLREALEQRPAKADKRHEKK